MISIIHKIKYRSDKGWQWAEAHAECDIRRRNVPSEYFCIKYLTKGRGWHYILYNHWPFAYLLLFSLHTALWLWMSHHMDITRLRNEYMRGLRQIASFCATSYFLWLTWDCFDFCSQPPFQNCTDWSSDFSVTCIFYRLRLVQMVLSKQVFVFPELLGGRLLMRTTHVV